MSKVTERMLARFQAGFFLQVGLFMVWGGDHSLRWTGGAILIASAFYTLLHKLDAIVEAIEAKSKASP